jgi:hypothetical protein
VDGGGVLQLALLVAASLAAAAALVAPRGRARALAVLAALPLAAGALATLVPDAIGDAVGGRPLLALAAAVAGAAAVAALAALFTRRPGTFALVALGALPFRVPVSVGDETASLLVPLYGVIAAGCVAHALAHLRGRPRPGGAPRGDRRVRHVEVALAVVLVLYAVQALPSTDPVQAVENAGFFYVPFALLFVLLTELDWDARLLRRAAGLVVGLAIAFALVGLAEYATGRLLVPNPKLDEANDLKPYFRVNSLFFDPNVYGRFLAVAMVVLAAVLLWTRRPRGLALAAGALALLWAGLVVSLSQSSFTALLAGLAVVAAVRWGPRPVLAVAAAGAAVAVALALLAPGLVGLERGSGDLDRATSGRVDLVRGGLDMAADRPLWGFGSGAYAERFRAREEVRDPDDAVISHTIPLTVAAEQGAIGLVGYLGLLLAAGSLLLGRLRGATREGAPEAAAVARVAVAAAFAALVVHTLSYAAFLEDPLAWVLLAIGAALWPVRRRRAARPATAAGDDGHPAPAAAAEAAPVRV